MKPNPAQGHSNDTDAYAAAYAGAYANLGPTSLERIKKLSAQLLDQPLPRGLAPPVPR